MLAWLVRSALKQRVLVLAMAALLVVLGLRASADVPLDVFPEFAPPIVEIQTEAPGLSTEEVESLITVPIETAVNGVPDLATLRSKSVLGLSSVTILFERGTDVIRARQLVQERVAQVQARLPAAARPPVMLPPLSSTSRAMKIGISSKKLDQMQLSELVRWTIRPKLMSVPGVANVAVWGYRDRQLQVLADPDRLQASGVTLAELRAATGDAVLVGGGGFVDTPNQRLPVQQASAIQTSEDLANTVIKIAGDAPVRVGDVARVTDGFAAPIGNAIIDDGPGLMLIVEKQPTGNTLQLTRDVEAAVAELRPGLKDVKIDTTIFRPATFIEKSIDNLTRALMIGCVLVAIVLFAFTRDWRQATISLVAIPLSLLAAGLVLLWSGATINTMVIAGLVIALGEVVDDAIIDVENIARRLRLNREAGKPRSAFAVVLSASLEVRTAVVFASLIVMLVFLPIFFLGGVAGTFFRPLAIAYVLAIAASLLVALVVTPAMCLMLLPNAPMKEHRDTRFVASLMVFAAQRSVENDAADQFAPIGHEMPGRLSQRRPAALGIVHQHAPVRQLEALLHPFQRDWPGTRPERQLEEVRGRPGPCIRPQHNIFDDVGTFDLDRFDAHIERTGLTRRGNPGFEEPEKLIENCVLHADRQGKNAVEPPLDRGKVFFEHAILGDDRQSAALLEVGQGHALQRSLCEEAEPAGERRLGIRAFEIVRRIEQILAAGLALATRQCPKAVEAPRDRAGEAQLTFAVGRDRPE